MKNILLISAVLFAIAACADSRQTGSDSQKDEFDINDYIGTFTAYTTGEGAKLIITKNGDEFRIINQDEYGGEYSCVFDGQFLVDWGGGTWSKMFFDCRTICSNYEAWAHSPYLTPYIGLRHYISDYKNIDYDTISVNTYLRGKEYYKECSAPDKDRQACKYQGGRFLRKKTGE